ncbi:MAG: hypothetical protein DI539_17455 [Flavobacterium psychrophilum]|nr:MAG: hypothetical protein DI539_17455 [Flavobacterium psychrophilum]
MSDFFDVLFGLSALSNSKQDKNPVKDKLIQTISIITFIGCVIILSLADINWQTIKQTGKFTEIIFIIIVTTIIVSVILYRFHILRDIMVTTFIFYLLSILITIFTIIAFSITFCI